MGENVRKPNQKERGGNTLEPKKKEDDSSSPFLANWWSSVAHLSVKLKSNTEQHIY